MQKLPELKAKRGRIAEERFKQLIGKLINTPVSNDAACRIHKVFKEVDRIQKESHVLFIELRDQFVKKDDQGKILAMKDDHGNELPDTWQILDDKHQEFNDAVNKMGDEDVILKCRPLTPDTLKDIKVSAIEIDLLGELFSPENGPGLPHLHPV